MKEVEETWAQQKFAVGKYMKGTSERGFILGAVDEVLQTLDDNAMQLQGIKIIWGLPYRVKMFLKNPCGVWSRANVLDIHSCSYLFRSD